MLGRLVILLMVLAPVTGRGELFFFTVAEADDGLCGSNLPDGCRQHPNCRTVAIEGGRRNRSKPRYASPMVEELAQEYGLEPDEEGNITVPIHNEYPSGVEPESLAREFGVPAQVVLAKKDTVSSLDDLVDELKRWRGEQLYP